ncbi:hypothetical protein RP20_CCG002385 [Aedes albopictus]|nr:hypothetical protein RP20_CCG002385 [Aedes albopictus]
MLDRYVNNSVLLDINDIDLYVDAEVKILAKQNDDELRLYDVYNNGLSLGGKLKVLHDREVFEHQSGKVNFGESKLGVKLKYQNRENLSDITMRVAIVSQLFPLSNGAVNHILKFFESYKQPEEDVAARMGYMLVKAIEGNLNFRIEWEHYNLKPGNESYKSNYDAVRDQQADLSIFGVANLNMDDLTCLQNFMAYRSMFIFRTPVSNSLTNNIFTQPFAMETWFTVALTILIGAVAVKINFITEEHLEQNVEEFHEHFSLYTMCMESLANFCQEGCEFINRSSPGRLSQMMLFACSIVVFNYYSSGFFSILMQGPQMSNIRTLNRLADSQLTVGIDGNVEAEEFFRASKHSDVHYLMEKKALTDNFHVDPAHGIQQVRDETHAYHCDRMIAYNVIRNSYDFSEMCDLNEIEVVPPQWVGLLIRKDSPFRELFNIKLARLREVGAFNRFAELWITKKPDCLVASVVSSVSMEGAFPIFLLLIAGTVAAFFAFALESGLFRAIGRRIGSSDSLVA